MPCMSMKKEKDEKAKNEKNNSTAKKIVKPEIQNIFKQIVTKVKNGGKIREVGTQIRYLGDGKTLSLMELDILRHTGCKWSKIIFPGFKGNIKPFLDKTELMKTADQFEKEGIQ